MYVDLITHASATPLWVYHVILYYILCENLYTILNLVIFLLFQ